MSFFSSLGRLISFVLAEFFFAKTSEVSIFVVRSCLCRFDFGFFSRCPTLLDCVSLKIQGEEVFAPLDLFTVNECMSTHVC